MALADIPKIPREYDPRIKALKEKIKNNEITAEEVRSNLLAVLGRITIDSGGIRAGGEFGSFEIDKRVIEAGRDSLLYACELLPKLFGKTFLIKKGEKYRKIKIGPGLRKPRASEKDIGNPRFPVVEFLRNPHTERTRIKVHRLEEFAAWLGDDWKSGSLLFKLAVPITDLLTKEVLDKLGESLAPFCDEVLKKCGV